MRGNPTAEIERAVRRSYECVLNGRDLDELDRELVEIAVDAQTFLSVCDACFKHQVLSERGKVLFGNATRALSEALSALGMDNPYRVSAH